MVIGGEPSKRIEATRPYRLASTEPPMVIGGEHPGDDRARVRRAASTEPPMVIGGET